MVYEICFKILEGENEGRWMKQDLQMLVILEAEVGYMGNHDIGFHDTNVKGQVGGGNRSSEQLG